LAPVRLLLVDDDESVLSGLKVILEAHEFEVTTAPNVVEALRLITSQSFDVLVSDLHMPGPGDGLIVVGAMRHANPRAVTLVLSANPDMAKATAAILREADEVFLKPPKVAPIVEAIRQRLAHENHDERLPRFQTVESIATVLERERPSITQAWLDKMAEIGSFAAVPISLREQSEHLPDALNEILYRLRYPQPLGLMTLFSMASLQHGARRRRQGLPSPVLVQEARAIQVALFQTIQSNLDRIDLGQLPSTLMAIADEINAQLLQSLSGYENEKPGDYPENGQ
jgi:ActR/RegA family two-component response regulator